MSNLPQIRIVIIRAFLYKFWRHVQWRTFDRSKYMSAGAHAASKSKITKLGHSVCVQENILWLQISNNKDRIVIMANYILHLLIIRHKPMHYSIWMQIIKRRYQITSYHLRSFLGQSALLVQYIIEFLICIFRYNHDLDHTFYKISRNMLYLFNSTEHSISNCWIWSMYRIRSNINRSLNALFCCTQLFIKVLSI